MYGLYDKEGILRFVDSDKDACIAYAELFESVSYTHLRAHETLLDLVADGLTNQEIAVKLTISKRTVDNHVSNMFTKTCLLYTSPSPRDTA